MDEVDLVDAFERSGTLLSLIDPQSDIEDRRLKLRALAELVSTWGSRINLTGYRDSQGVFGGLVIDALELLVAVQARLDHPAHEVADLGSGAGFPGLPIAIASPRALVTLVEARRRRHHFQRSACRSIPIENARPIRGRLEAEEPRPASLVFAQAVGPLPKVLELALPWVRPGGWLVVPSGPRLESAPAGPSWGAETVQAYGQPGSEGPRRFWMGCRTDFPLDSP